MTRLRTLPVVAGLLVGLTACGGGTSGTSASPSSSSTPRTTVSSTPLPAEPDLGDGAQGIAKDVTITDCPTATGEQTAKGTVVNSAAEARDLSIIIVWLADATGGDPLASGITVLQDVPAGETREWSVSGNVVTQADRCVVNARSGQQK